MPVSKHRFTRLSSCLSVLAVIGLTLTLLTQKSSFAITPEHLPDTPVLQLKPFTATYSATIKGVPLSGKATRTLQQNKDGSFALYTKAQTFFNQLEEHSQFHWKGCLSVPEKYSQRRKTFGKNRKHQITFEHEKNIARYSGKKGDKSITIPNGTSDTLSEQLVVRCLVKQGLPEFTVNVVSKDRLRQHTFEVVGDDTVKTETDTLSAVKVKRIHDKKKRQTTLWFAPELDYMLIKLQQVTDGKVYTIRLTRWHSEP